MLYIFKKKKIHTCISLLLIKYYQKPKLTKKKINQTMACLDQDWFKSYFNFEEQHLEFWIYLSLQKYGIWKKKLKSEKRWKMKIARNKSQVFFIKNIMMEFYGSKSEEENNWKKRQTCKMVQGCFHVFRLA